MSSDIPIVDGTWTVARRPDGEPQWVEITSFLQRERHRLPKKHHAFIDDMAKVWRRAFTPKQEQYLLTLFLKLEGKATTNWPWG